MSFRILITRPRKDAVALAQLLQAIGAQPFYLPTIEITPLVDTSTLDRTLACLHNYDWVIFTSVNAVAAVSGRWSALGMGSLPPKLSLAAIGTKTAARLAVAGWKADYTPDKFIAEAILPGLGDLRGRWVLLPTADLAHDTLPQSIAAMGGVAHVVTAYHTKPAQLEEGGLAALRQGLDVITFTSGSSARNFFTLLQRLDIDPFDLPGKPSFACIGPKTAQVARDLGWSVDIVAETYTVEGLALAIYDHLSAGEQS